MKWGLTTLICHRQSLNHCFRSARDLGYEYVELNCVRGYYEHCNALQLADMPEELVNLRNSLKANNLRCSAVDCHGIFGREAEEFQYMFEYMKAGFTIAEALQSPMVITSYPPGPTPWPRLVEATRALCREAKKKHLTIAVEAEYGYPVGSPETLFRLLTEVEMDNLKVNFDPFHFERANLDACAVLEDLYPHVVHVHLKEYRPGTPHPTRYTGVAGTPADRMLDFLAAAGFNGVVSAETLAEPDVDPQEAMLAIMNGIHQWEKREERRNHEETADHRWQPEAVQQYRADASAV